MNDGIAARVGTRQDDACWWYVARVPHSECVAFGTRIATKFQYGAHTGLARRVALPGGSLRGECLVAERRK